MAEIQINEINRALAQDPVGVIKESDKKYSNGIDLMERHLEESGACIILLAGPSSSGKTTTANILKDRLTLRGHKTAVVSMDNFYRDINASDYPRDEFGELDFEAVEALDTELIKRSIDGLISGKRVKLPQFLFSEGRSVPDADELCLPRGGFVIIEGLHALNPKITDGLAADKIMKLFISVSTNINDGDKRLISGRKLRFIRRMTRDSIYRNTDAYSTLARWKSVISGEDKYLYPYKSLADISLDTFHVYELGIMKPFALSALENSSAEPRGEFIEIIKKALSLSAEADISNVPDTSLIREFVPGGKYESLYK